MFKTNNDHETSLFEKQKMLRPSHFLCHCLIKGMAVGTGDRGEGSIAPPAQYFANQINSSLKIMTYKCI